MNPIVPPTAGRPGGRPVDLAIWLADIFIPGWIGRTCLPGRAGYVEEVSAHDGTPIAGEQRTTLVTARLVYTYSIAYSFDGRASTLAAARHGLRFLLDSCHLGEGRYAHAVEGCGQIADGDADLYDLAFVLLAFGAWAQGTGDGACLALTRTIGDRLDTELADPAGGYREPGSGAGRRRQFPQMHLFEVFRLLHALAPADGWDRRAARMLDLIDRLSTGSGGIDEWYGPEWQPLDADTPNDKEIGHHFEWAWLLYRHAADGGPARAADIADRLYQAGLAAARLGPDTFHHLVPNRLDATGSPIMTYRPLWPTTEFLRATLEARAVGRQAGCHPMIETALDLIWGHAIDARTGLWRNIVDERHEMASPVIPVRVLYHLVPCLLACLQAHASME